MASLKQKKKHEQLGRIVFNSGQQDHHMIRESCGLSQGLLLFIRPEIPTKHHGFMRSDGKELAPTPPFTGFVS